ncbi:unnamed protein product, partial [marine sediment metagenome]
NEQLHQRFSTEEIKTFLEEYLNDKTKLFYILEILRITRRRFFQLLKEYRSDPDNFSIQYKRKRVTRQISKDVEKNIISELEKETSWQHILALQEAFLTWGIPFTYYVDSHSIFRFVQGRDSLWRKHYRLTDEVDTQWKMVIDEYKVKPIYALSPQAKGKIERPYRWMQDRIVRTCAREGIETIEEAGKVLENEAT